MMTYVPEVTVLGRSGAQRGANRALSTARSNWAKCEPKTTPNHKTDELAMVLLMPHASKVTLSVRVTAVFMRGKILTEQPGCV